MYEVVYQSGSDISANIYINGQSLADPNEVITQILEHCGPIHQHRLDYTKWCNEKLSIVTRRICDIVMGIISHLLVTINGKKYIDRKYTPIQLNTTAMWLQFVVSVLNGPTNHVPFAQVMCLPRHIF